MKTHITTLLTFSLLFVQASYAANINTAQEIETITAVTQGLGSAMPMFEDVNGLATGACKPGTTTELTAAEHAANNDWKTCIKITHHSNESVKALKILLPQNQVFGIPVFYVIQGKVEPQVK